jgi:hypothetical protein
MPLPPFEELIEIDVPTEKRDKIDYLNWAKCVELLHENGAKVVWFEPICNENGSSLFMSNQVFTDNKGNTNRCYEVKVHIKIDDLEFDMNHPLMNGANPVKDNSLSQQRVWNAQTRAFVKGVAIRTGLGFKLWIKDDSPAEEDLSKHSISKIRQRVLEKMTSLMKSGLSKDDVDQKLEENKVTETAIYEFIGKGKGTFDKYNRLYILLDAFEKALDKL